MMQLVRIGRSLQRPLLASLSSAPWQHQPQGAPSLLQAAAAEWQSSPSCASTSQTYSALAQHPLASPQRLRTSPAAGPLTVQYPFPIRYLKDREMLLLDLARKPLGVERLQGALFNQPVRVDILHRNVRYLRAKWQQGTHKAKTRGEVSGGSRKPRPQKKTGRSRQGSIRSPLWKGGGASFGPRPRSHAHKLPKNVQLLGMKCALSAKCNEGRMVLVESLASLLGTPVKPRAMVPMLAALVQAAGGAKTALLVDCGEYSQDGGKALRAAGSMMGDVEVMAVSELTVYHVLKYNALVISQPALAMLAEQLANPPHRNRLPLRAAWWRKELSEFESAAAELRS